jgi:hypothetical protein
LKQWKIKLEIGYGYTPNQREQIANDIIDFIRMRTIADNRDYKNKSFSKYTKNYKEEKGTGTVNLKNTGDMLDNLKVLKVYTDSITIGYEKGYDGMGKVEGNILGTYGQSEPIPGKARNFLGITENDLKRILKAYPKDETISAADESIARESRRLTREDVEKLERESFLRSLNLSSL